ncbi:MAG: hypothetical protein LBM13_01330, partial [Candidatus Ancillula sp.]|nr:hypothetical protein [Candidatus Ancillula sp.]
MSKKSMKDKISLEDFTKLVNFMVSQAKKNQDEKTRTRIQFLSSYPEESDEIRELQQILLKVDEPQHFDINFFSTGWYHGSQVVYLFYHWINISTIWNGEKILGINCKINSNYSNSPEYEASGVKFIEESLNGFPSKPISVSNKGFSKKELSELYNIFCKASDKWADYTTKIDQSSQNSKSTTNGVPIKEVFIRKLFNQEQVELSFSNKVHIYIGENGIGKTTILSILYYTLIGNVKQLEKYDFSSLKLNLDSKKEIEFTHDEIVEYNEFSTQRRNLLFEWAKRIKHSLEYDQYKSIRDNVRNDDDKYYKDLYDTQKSNLNMDKISFIRGCTYINDRLPQYGNIEDYIHEIECLNTEFEVLYFPTYRGIKLDEEEVLKYEHKVRISRRTIEHPEDSRFTGELTQFSMKDISDEIDNLLGVIKTESVKNFNAMTSELLKQYLDDTIDNGNLNKMLNNINHGDLEIALSRIGSQISEKIQRDLLEKFDNDELSNNPNLANIVIKIVESYKKIQVLDDKLNNFVKTCNKYLYN